MQSRMIYGLVIAVLLACLIWGYAHNRRLAVEAAVRQEQNQGLQRELGVARDRIKALEGRTCDQNLLESLEADVEVLKLQVQKIDKQQSIILDRRR